ncbi:MULTISPECIES: hypothetical protein [Cysteiniphilum]|uniref:hypothetical protein n=1 Tax=Cysteiniphilum TaxID=2056696 RepID=UPI00177DAE24|nr:MULTISPECIES: hypothetical protein [Cysteiniphilum]
MPAVNQYGANFETMMCQRFGKSAKEVLLDFQNMKLSYCQVSEITGFAMPTIRKWTRRYKIVLITPSKIQSTIKRTPFQQGLLSGEMNIYNCLSRPWVNHS